MHINHDPKLYRELNVPFADPKEAEAAIQAFQTELADLRNKHRIADVVCVARVNAVYEDREQSLTAYGSYGSSLYVESMLAWALGKEQGERKMIINSYLAGSK